MKELHFAIYFFTLTQKCSNNMKKDAFSKSYTFIILHCYISTQKRLTRIYE